MDLVKRLITEAPLATSFRNDKPSLLVSWWCTVYAFAIILVRLGGRYVRAEKVFLEDAIMMGAIIPLLIRMGFVQIVLSHGTNNTVTDGLSNFDTSKRELGSQMVMASRVFYAVYLWTIKYSVSVFLKTLTASVWQRSHAKILRYLHIFLVFTFIATVVADLSSCQPFSHNWQVVPDPGSKCRQNYAHLITTGSMDALTNLVLVVFPMPMILSSSLPRKPKFTIALRLALPLLPIILTAWTIPKILAHAGFQPYRSLLASFSILLTTFSSNAVVLTSLLQDKGYKKSKFKHVIEIAGKGSGTPGLDRDGKNRMSYVEEGWMDSDDELIVQSNKMVREGVEMGVLRRDEVGRGVLAEPKRAKLGEIKVASSWEISVDERGSHGG